MTVPLWLALLAVGYLGIKHLHPPAWLIAVLLLGGFVLAQSPIAAPLNSALQ
ncbi:SpdC2 protein [Streptomyces albus]|uniref:SpdC2 protein n=1 Tax=Streptomyces albus (strain ATCC 21838 / DSM 41398 / FERM P-419 / JCM 4703 / NBRC 107858) TaxID=1081613 RepID=A0A0B5EN51_STRA4|nr:SpdC2 protein [Streptomyces albus]AOU78307.1 SpdC2 protein [Streptomyces albus]AYN34058.1 SpdC2 protein [Streptomyces albus]